MTDYKFKVLDKLNEICCRLGNTAAKLDDIAPLESMEIFDTQDLIGNLILFILDESDKKGGKAK